MQTKDNFVFRCSKRVVKIALYEKQTDSHFLNHEQQITSFTFHKEQATKVNFRSGQGSNSNLRIKLRDFFVLIF